MKETRFQNCRIMYTATSTKIVKLFHKGILVIPDSKL